MKKNRASESGLLNWRILTTLALCSGSAWLALFSFAATLRTVTYVDGGFTFANPVELTKTPISPIFFQQDGEPEIHVDNYGDIYVTAINGVPGGTDLWKSTDKGATFVYLGEPDGAQDKCSTLLQCAGLGGGDDSTDVSPGGYLYVSSLWIGNVTVSTSMDGGTGGTEPGQAWQVNPAAASVIVDDRQWIAAYGPQTLNMTYRQAPGTGALFFNKSTDAGKTFGTPVLMRTGNSTEGNLVVDPYNGNLYTTTIPANATRQIHLLKSVNGGASWTETTAYAGAVGSNPGHKFTILAVDRGGNLHLVFSESHSDGSYHVYLTSSTDQGASWLSPVQVDSGIGDTTYAVMPWVVAGSPGVVDITWLGSPNSPNSFPSAWYVYFAQTRNALSTSGVTFNEQKVLSKSIHDQDICFNGSGCTDNPRQGGGNRDLLEYYTVTLDPDGNANIAYPDSLTADCPANACITNAWFVKQSGGASAFAPPAPPAAATFGANVNVAANGGGGAEPNSKADSHNCMFSAAPGHPDFWKSVNNGASFLAPVNPVLGQAGVTGEDEDILTLPQASGARPDILYFADLGISSVHIRKSIDGGATWFAPGTGGVAGEVSVSSDRQWLAYDHVPTATDTTVYEMDHELATEVIRFSASTNDGAWRSTSGITNSELLLPPDSTVPNTNPGPAFTFVDPTDNSHKIGGVFCASTVRTNRAQPPFGKLPNVWDAIGAAPLTASAAPGPFTNYPVFKGVQDSPTTPAPPAGATTYGNNTANDFPTAAVDSAGNIYVAWSMNDARINHFNIWYAVSHDHGKTFYGPFQVSSGPGHAVMPWIAAGDAGRLDIVFYQTNGTQDPNTSTTDQWTVKFAQSLNAAAREPVFTTVQASDHVNHTGPICNLGILCGSGTRDLLDFFQVAIGPDGLANIVYADDSSGPTNRHPEFARQTSGPLALNNPVTRTCVPLPDLIVSNLTASNSQAPQGSKIPITATIKNQGEANAGASSTTFVLDGKTTIGTVPTSALAVGASTSVVLNWDTASVKKGNHTITAAADGQNQVAESNENNNTSSSISIFIQGNKTR